MSFPRISQRCKLTSSLPLLAIFPSWPNSLLPSQGSKSLSQGLLWGKPKPTHWPQPITSFLLDLAGHESLFLRFPLTAGRGPWFVYKRDMRVSKVLSIVPHPVAISPFIFFSTSNRFKESNLLDRNYQNITQGPLACLEKLNVSYISENPEEWQGFPYIFLWCWQLRKNAYKTVHCNNLT